VAQAQVIMTSSGKMT